MSDEIERIRAGLCGAPDQHAAWTTRSIRVLIDRVDELEAERGEVSRAMGLLGANHRRHVDGTLARIDRLREVGRAAREVVAAHLVEGLSGFEVSLLIPERLRPAVEALREGDL